MPNEHARPSDDELAEPGTCEWDVDYIKGHFAGKTVVEAIRMFEERAEANIAEDFLFMSHMALAYYLPTALAYLTSASSERDGGFLDWITTSLSIRRDTDKSLPPEVRQQIRDVATYLKDHLQKFSCCNNPAHVPEYTDRLDSMSDPG
jgi:hypothetical protein